MKLEFIEGFRKYFYESGFSFEVKGVIAVRVSKSGTHYLETEKGEKFIVNPGWTFIQIDTEQWTF